MGGGLSSADDAVPASDMAQQMEQASILSLSFSLMLSLAAAIATFGLIANSAPAIIGAMIIAPLMSPIMSLSYGLVAFERELIFRSALTVIVGVILVILIGYVITLLFGLRITGTEILNRTSPTLIDLAVAMAAGGAAAFANTRRSILSSIAGVAIAVALVPPLAVSGIGLALGGKATAEGGMSLSEFGNYSGGTDIALGAFVLFATNFVGIVAVAICVFVCQRIGEWKKALFALVLCLGLSALLFEPLNRELHELYVKHRVARLIAKLSFERPDIVTGKGKIESITVAYRDGILHVNMDGLLPKDSWGKTAERPDMQRRLEEFQEILSKDINEPVVVELDFIPIEIIEMRAGPPNQQEPSPLHKQ